MAKTFDILVAGELNPDLILSGDVAPAFGQVEQLVDSAALTIGSSSAIFACGAARLGLKVAFVGVCGDDLFGRFMLDELIQRGVNVSAVLRDPNRPTGLSVILNRGADRAILTHPGTIPSLRAEQVGDGLLLKARHLHVASYFLQTALQPGLPSLFQRAHNLGLSTSLDPNWDPASAWQGFETLLPKVDVFLPNQNEALALTGLRQARSAAKKLAGQCQTVAVKQGGRGALACRAEEIVQAEALAVEVVDTVGAGDSFDAGFLYGWLEGWDLAKTLRMAVVCGSLSTRAAGGTSAQASLAEALQA
jgi:sugar/nucleoside kinase (ribokinase family)